MTDARPLAPVQDAPDEVEDAQGAEDTPTEAAPAPSPRGGGLIPAALLAPARPAPRDDDAPVVPDWAKDRSAVALTARRFARRWGRRIGRWAVRLPLALLLLVTYSPRGAGRIIAKVAAYLYDYDSAQVRHHHAGQVETKEYVQAQNVRKANLKARWLVATTAVVLLVAPVLAYLAPLALGGVSGLLLCILIVKAIPGRSMEEIAIGAAVGTIFGGLVWWGCGYLPPLPLWPFITAGVLVVLVLGWIGRPERPLIAADNTPEAAELEKPSAPVIIDALVTLGVQGFGEKQRELVRVYAPGVARAPRGYIAEFELPPGITASAIMDKREAFAGALRRRLGTVWPSRGPSHPGHLVVFISDQPMTDAPQGKWRVAEGRERDIFGAIPMFTDQQGRWVDLTFAYNHFVIGGAPGFGKSFLVRQLGVAVAFDPRVQIVTLDGKGNGDLRPLRLVAHGFHEGDEDDEIKEQLSAVKVIREEMRRRNRFLRELPPEENPGNKVTTQLVDKYPHLAPIVLIIDEVQVYTEHEDRDTREEFIRLFTDLVKRGRSAGVIPVFCTQKPDAKALPSGITDNCTMRVCFKVNGWRSNDQVLGTEMHANGVKATLFSTQDKGIAYLRGDAQDAQIVRTVVGLDQVKAEDLCAQARAIREAKGLLTGYAAGEEAAEEERQVDFLADSRSVMDNAGAARMHLAHLRDALAQLASGAWTHLDVNAVGDMLRAAGVPTRQVKVDGRNSTGVRREDLNVAATSDVDPDGFNGRSGDAEDMADDEDRPDSVVRLDSRR